MYRRMQLTWKSSSTPIVTISVKDGVKFYVHKTVLTLNSSYFDRALNGAFRESSTQSIDLDDIHAEDFGRYINVVYQTVLTQNVTLVDMNDQLRPCSSTLPKLLRIWQLADRFLDPKMKDIAQKSIDSQFELLSTRAWEKVQESYHPTSMSNRFKRLQLAFDLCKQENIPYQDHLVTGLANCPPHIFADYVEDLNGDFKRAVIKAFALRFVDCHVSSKVVKNQTPKKTPRKRKLNEDSMV